MHDGQQSGREGACPLEICTKLLMLCWSNAKLRREVLLLDKCPVVSERSRVRTAKEFAEWLLADEKEKSAGFLVAMQWAYESLALRRYCVLLD